MIAQINCMEGATLKRKDVALVLSLLRPEVWRV